MLFGKRSCCQPQPMPCQRQECPCQDPGQRQTQMVMEPTITNCVEKEFYHEVPHCCPIHTHVVNKHIYTHTYTPQYSCSEENVMINNDCGSCSGFIGR